MDEKELKVWFKHQLTIKNDEMAGETNRWLHVYSATGPSTSSPTEERAAVPEPSTNAPQQSAPRAARSSSASATTPGFSKRHTGIVKKYRADKGFGFVVPDREDMQGQDLFVHCTKIANGDFLVPNTRVTFAMGWNERSQKWQAVDVWMLP